jgi:hypothetical protein
VGGVDEGVSVSESEVGVKGIWNCLRRMVRTENGGMAAHVFFGRLIVTWTNQAAGARIVDKATATVHEVNDAWNRKRHFDGVAIHLAPWRRNQYGDRREGPAIVIGWRRHWSRDGGGYSGRMSTAALLMLALALPASAAEPRCSGSLALWTGTSTYTGGNQAVMVGSRAEGGCNTVAGIRIGARADFTPLPGKTVDFSAPNIEDVAAVEVWGVASKRIAGPLSIAVFGGAQKSLEGGQLGIGASTNSLCVGGRLDSGGAYALAGLCSRYAPVQRSEPRKDGPAIVGTLVMPVKANVSLAANGALMSGDYLLTVGPAVSWGSK